MPIDIGKLVAYNLPMFDGQQLLRAWMVRRDLNGRETAKLLGIHFTLLSNYITGKRRPGLTNAVKIERLTGIVIEAWTPTYVAHSVVAVRRHGVKHKNGKQITV